MFVGEFLCKMFSQGNLSGFRKRGLANGVSPFFQEMKRKKEENGKKRKKTKKKTEENGKKERKKMENIGSDTVPATLFAKPQISREIWWEFAGSFLQAHIIKAQKKETTKDPEVKGSRSQQRAVTDHPPLSYCN